MMEVSANEETEKKVRLRCRIESRETVAAMLANGGFEVSEDGVYIFYESGHMPDYVVGKAKDDSGDLRMIKFAEILYFESFGHNIYMVTEKGELGVKDKIYQLEAMLPPQLFMRVSQSVIVNRDNIKKISPGIGAHYFLTMKNNVKVDVTRNYYNRFKTEIGI